MTILTPTDFSKLSKVAVLYSARIAKKLKADIILLAVIDMNSYTTTSMRWTKLEDEMISIAQEEADRFIKEIKEEIKGNVKITYRYVTGYPVEERIEEFVKQNGIDMIVMGTRGASGLKKVVMGSNATAVIDNSSVPVIAVPGQTAFKAIKEIVYASDMVNLSEEIKTIAMFASLFNANIHVLHVLPRDSAKKIDGKKTVSSLVKQTKYPNIFFHVSKSDHIAEGVDAFVAHQKADLLTMFTHKLDFYEKLFGRSVTRHLAFHVHVPLLTFNKTTLL
jgi:nucleotide-binding universal stress UspA family protein